MTAFDAQFHWISAKVPNDQFALYAFDGEPDDLGDALEQIRRRARACPDLAMRVEETSALRYPRWVPADIGPEHTVHHLLADDGWDACLAAVAALAENQLDPRELPWRLHVFTPVRGLPGLSGPGTVAVWQATHSVADGRRAAAMTAWLFGRSTPVPSVPLTADAGAGFLPWRAFDAARTHRRFVRDTRAGLLAPGVGTRPPLSTNNRPAGVRTVRTLLRHRSQLSGPTVTVGVLSAVGSALAELLGASADSLGAEVPMAKAFVRQGYNHFGNVGVRLYPELGHDDRARRIATDLANARRRFAHPAIRASDRAFAATPAAVLRWGISKFDPDTRPPRVTGNTVVSSVRRGAADLSFGGCAVVFTAGYPALSPVMGLTHGVHGIGDTIAISVHAAESAVPDIDHYLALLEAAL